MAKTRKPRGKREAKPARFEMQERDVDIIDTVRKCRILTQRQIQTLYFTGTSGQYAARRRLRLLYDHAYLDRRFLPVVEGMGRSQTLYILDRAGSALLKARRGYEQLAWYSTSKEIRTEFLEHTIAINDFVISVMLACQRQGIQFETWLTESELKRNYDRVNIEPQSGKHLSVAVIPDSYVVLNTPLGHTHLFLELDRGTEDLGRIKQKIQAYLAYHKTGGYERRYHARSLRVLIVTDGEKRMANLKAATEEITDKTWFWFATLASLNPETVLTAPVWHQAGNNLAHTLINLP